MARSTPNQYPVKLTEDQRERFERLTRTGSAPASKVRHARVLLLSDGDRPGGRRTREQIADALGMHVNTVDRLRKRFVLEGEEVEVLPGNAVVAPAGANWPVARRSRFQLMCLR